MSASDPESSSFFAELKRRRVFRVAAVYAAGAWLVLQAAATVSQLLGLPAWSGKLIVALVVVGFPLALALAWAYDLTPAGIRRTTSPTPSLSPGRRLLSYGLAGLGIVAGMAGLIAVSMWLVFRPPPAPEDPPAATPSSTQSLAVLPFDEVSSGKDSTYFADGLTEELIAAIGRIPGIRVISRTSAFAFRDKRGLTLRQIADSLGVAAVLEGSVRREHNRLRVIARLVDVAADSQLMVRQFERELSDVFALQDDIAKDIAGALRLRLSDTTEPNSVRTNDVEAYDLYLQGRDYFNQRTPAALRASVARFQAAIARDSGYVAAYVGLSDALTLTGLLIESPRTMRARALAAANRALQIDSTSGGAHAALGHALFNFYRDYKSGDHHLSRALALDSSYNAARLYLGIMYNDLGQSDRAIAMLRQALDRDPLSPPIRTTLGRIYVTANQPDSALEQLRISAAINPAWAMTYVLMGHALVAQGKPAEALAEFQRAANLGSAADSAHLAYGLAVTGQRAAAEELLRTIVRQPRESFGFDTHIAIAYAGLGNREAAFRWLDRLAQGNGSPSFALLPALAPLRSDPRFARLLRALGVSP